MEKKVENYGLNLLILFEKCWDQNGHKGNYKKVKVLKRSANHNYIHFILINSKYSHESFESWSLIWNEFELIKL